MKRELIPRCNRNSPSGCNQKRVFLGLGANVGDKKANIKKAIGYLSENVSDIKLSPIYETKPWGYEKQDNFLNAAVSGKTSLSPSQLLKFVKDAEKKVGRIKRFKWGPREIDIDILFYDDLIYKDDDVVIPHPHLHERDFVLKPLMDLDPNFVHPVFKEKVCELYKALSQKDSSIVCQTRIEMSAFSGTGFKTFSPRMICWWFPIKLMRCYDNRISF